MADCLHKHGDHVPILNGWVCGKCYALLERRPQKLAIVPVNPLSTGRSPDAPKQRQEVVWEAEIRKSPEGTRLRVFMKWMAHRYMRKGGLAKVDAWRHALESLRMQEEEFGDPDYCWDRAGAADIVDEEMSYWDADDSAGANA